MICAQDIINDMNKNFKIIDTKLDSITAKLQELQKNLQVSVDRDVYAGAADIFLDQEYGK